MSSGISIKPSFQLLSKIPEVGNLVGLVTISYEIIKRKLKESVFGIGGDWAKRNISDEWKQDFYWLLETHSKEAFVLIMEALLLDLKTELSKNAISIIISLDQFELVDDSNHDYPFQERNLTEADLWLEFIKGIRYCVGIFATNRRMREYQAKSYNVHTMELDNLNIEECREYLKKREIASNMIPHIIKISFQHPLTVSTICDLIQMKVIDNPAILDADSVEEVYGKIWDRISRDNTTREIIIDLSILDFFDVEILSLIRPETKYTLNSICRWSFISQSEDYYRLHDFTRKIVLRGLNKNNSRVKEISERLVESYVSFGNSIHLALAISAISKFEENSAIEILLDHMNSVLNNPVDAMNFVKLFELASQKGKSLERYLEGLILMRMYQLDESKRKLEESLKICRQLNDDECLDLLCNILEKLSHVLTRLNQYDSAIGYIDESLVLRRSKTQTGNWLDLFSTLINRGYVLYYWDIFQCELSYSEAMEILEDNLGSNTDKISIGRIAEAYNLGGLINYRKGSFTEAENLFRKSLDIAEANFDNNIEDWLEFYTSTMNNLGGLLSSIDHLDESEDLFIRTIDTLGKYQEGGDVPVKSSLSTIFNQYSLLLDRKGNRMKSEQMHLKSVELSRELIDVSHDVFARDFVLNVRNYAFSLAHRGELFAAEMYYNEALDVCEKIYEKYPRAFTGLFATLITDIAILYTHTNRDGEANTYFEKGVEIFRKMSFLDGADLSTFSKALYNLGGIISEADINQAISYMNEAIDVSEILVINFTHLYPGGLFLIAQTLLDIHLYNKNLSEARLLLGRMKNLCKKIDTVDIRKNCREQISPLSSRIKKFSNSNEND